MKRSVKFIFVLLFYCSYIYAQELGDEVLIEVQQKQQVQYHVYIANEQVLYKVDKESEVNRKIPEGLVQSFFSANTPEWVKNDYIEKKITDSRDSKHFERVKAFKKDKNFIRLISKYSFEFDGKHFCYIFYLLELEGIDFKFPSLLSCVKENDRWYVYNLSNQAKIKELLMIVKPDVFKLILSKEKTQDNYLNDIILNVSQKSSEVSIEKLHTIIKGWNDRQEIDNLKKYTNY